MNWLLKNVALPNRQELSDLVLVDGLLNIRRAGETSDSSLKHWDLEGRLALPGLVEMHTHLDKTYSPIENPEGTLWGAIDAFSQYAQTRTPEMVYDNAEKALRRAIGFGVTRIRTHVNLGAVEDLSNLEVLLELRRSYEKLITVQFVGMGGFEGVEGELLLAQAKNLGIDLIGGAPALTDDPRASVERVVRLARRFELAIDLHIDETESIGISTLDMLAQEVESVQLDLPVTASHCSSLAFMPEDMRKAILTRVARAGISVVGLPVCNMVLLGHGAIPLPRGTAPIDELQSMGVNVCVGSDNVHDPFNPYGGYDPLLNVQISCILRQRTNDQAIAESLSLVCESASQAFDGSTSLLNTGKPADLVVLDCQHPVQAVCDPPSRLATFKGGDLVVATTINRSWMQEI